MSFTLMIPELPDYLSNMGGKEYKGYIIGLFTVAAAVARPISGKLSDTIGRRPVMIIGGMVCVIMSVLYPLFTFVFGFLALRFFHGFSTGFMPTGTVAYLADIIPKDRRGEAMGLVGIMNNIGFMAGNAMGSWVTRSIGINNMFYLSGGLAVLSVAIIFWMKETLPNKQKFKLHHLTFNFKDVYDKRALRPALTMMLTACTFGALLTLAPDFSKGFGIVDKGLFMLYLTLSTIGTRLLTARLSDRIGRAKSCIIGTVFWILGGLSLATLNYHMFFAGAILCGMASGVNSPAIFAWAVDVSNGIKSGRALATLYIALEIGIGGGAWISAAIYNNSFINLRWTFIALAGINFIALLLVSKWVKRDRIITAKL